MPLYVVIDNIGLQFGLLQILNVFPFMDFGVLKMNMIIKSIVWLQFPKKMKIHILCTCIHNV